MAHEQTPGDLVQGTLHMLILKTLALEPMHGYGIGVRLEQISKGVFEVNAGSLFPALRRLERDALIAASGRSRKTTAAPGIAGSPRSGAQRSNARHATGKSRPGPSPGSSTRPSESCDVRHLLGKRTAGK
jgi:PadR family transcriptional regulator